MRARNIVSSGDRVEMARASLISDAARQRGTIFAVARSKTAYSAWRGRPDEVRV